MSSLRRCALAVGVAVVVSSCGGSDGTITPTDPGPSPSQMCPAGQHPILAAYALSDGAFRWATCDTSRDMHVAVAATATDVWVEVPSPRQVLRIDAASGEIVNSSDPGYADSLPGDADQIRRMPPGNDEVQVRGGQDDPLAGFDRETSAERWRAIGFPVYDDVWAGDDEAVYVESWDPTGSEPGTWIVAYLLDSGAERWRIDGRTIGYPWHVADGRLFALWFDLHVIDTADGSVIWNTSFGEPAGGYPRMFGAVANDDTVFVSFTSVESGGD